MLLNLHVVCEGAKKQTPWHLSNEVLYQLCRNYPRHTEPGVVLAKVLLIGRAYAAAIERRKLALSKSNDDFYVRRVAPRIMNSAIDRWIEKAKRQKPGTPEALTVMCEIHRQTTGLFNEISGLQKRSLASKYLHFHVPELFFIYDSRAVKGMQKCGDIVAGGATLRRNWDYEYATFAQKCMRLSRYFKSEFHSQLKPRQLDNALLELSKE